MSTKMNPGALADSYTPALRLPFWSDGANWGQSQYYSTIQCADINGDGKAELLGRGPGGILANTYDQTYGQWSQLPSGPLWSDAQGWASPECYSTIQLGDIDGDGLAELFALTPPVFTATEAIREIQAWKFEQASGAWIQMPASIPVSLLWNEPFYYSTIQCADIDGDGRAEVLARDATGIVWWKFDSSSGVWSGMPQGPAWSDAAAWTQSQYFSTIHCADIDGDRRAELLARGADGIEAWKFENGAWSRLQGTPMIEGNMPLADIFAFNQAEYYSTIQYADIDGDGRAELLARYVMGMFAWKYDAGEWKLMATLPDLGDGKGWNQPQYYSTIQCADIDGDGRAELLGRGVNGMQVWKLDLESLTWAPMPAGPAWSDASFWNKPQYYSTIRCADVDGDGKAELLGRNPHGMETWKFDPASNQWQQWSADFPQFTSGPQLAAYNYINSTLRGSTAQGDLRAQYATVVTSDLQDWYSDLTGAKFNTAPEGIPPDDWNTVLTQITTEVQYAGAVRTYYEETGAQIDKIFGADSLILGDVADKVQLTSDDNSTSLILNTFGILANGAWAALGLVSPAGPSVLAGLLATAISVAQQAGPDDGSIQIEYIQLQDELLKGYNLTSKANIQNSATAVGDWGLLASMGTMIKAGTWTDPNNDVEAFEAVQYGYELSLWQLLMPLKWLILQCLDIVGNSILPKGYPEEYSYSYSGTKGYIGTEDSSSGGCFSYMPLTTLQYLFTPQPDGLGVSVDDIFLGRNGWNLFKAF